MASSSSTSSFINGKRISTDERSESSKKPKTSKKDKVSYKETITKQARPSTTDPNKTSRSWFGTRFPNREDEIRWECDRILPPFPFRKGETEDGSKEFIEWFRGQWEQGDHSNKEGRLHYQFCLKIKSPRNAKWVTELLGVHKLWLEPCMSEFASKQYCVKGPTAQGGKIEWGDISHAPGARTDLQKLYERIRTERMPIYQVMDEYPAYYLRMSTGLTKYCSRYERGRFDLYGPSMEVEVEIWWGVTAAGKSTRAIQDNPGAYTKMVSEKWWDGYTGQSCVIFEDYEYYNNNALETDRAQKLKTWFDNKNAIIEIKHGSCQLLATKFIITTNEDPTTWFKLDSDYSKDALCRRITKVLKFTKAWKDQKFKDDGILEWPGLVVS